MNNLAKLGLAIFLALVAFGLNMMYLASKERPTYYLALSPESSAIKAGETFPREEVQNTKYIPIAIAGIANNQDFTMIRYEDRAVLYGRKTARDLKPGDPIFHRDLGDDTPRYELLGRFKLLSVGEQLTGTYDPNDDGNRSSGSSVITIEPKYEAGTKDLHMDTRRLLQILDNSERNNRNAVGFSSSQRIVSIVAHPSSAETGMSNSTVLVPSIAHFGEQTQTVPKAKVHQAENAIFVPISNAMIENVVKIGTEISFLLPAYP